MPLRSLAHAKRSRDSHPMVAFAHATLDLRDFEVRTRVDEERVGVVDDLLLDSRGCGRYLCVVLEGEERHVLVPCGYATSEHESCTVWLAGLSKRILGKLRDYRHDPAEIDAEYEQRLSSIYRAAGEEDRYAQADYRARGWGRGKGDHKRKIERLDRLKHIEVRSGDPDPRGWRVIGLDDSTLGRIDELIGDTESMKVIYLDMKVGAKPAADARHVLIPAGHATLDTEGRRVRVDVLGKDRIAMLPTYSGSLDPEEERSIARVFEEGYAGERRYEHPRYSDESLYGEARIDRDEERLRVGESHEPAGASHPKRIIAKRPAARE